ncbi:MAG TPA: ABC transporter ATP-binding protein [Bacteriovoracaceae bacterium]|nr:ABC transporter ATP-binding protein [Bacteriovoracaceae bacterium]
MIKLTGVTKKFDQRGIAGVDQLDLTLGAGEVLALMGPNGSGKTTLLNLIAGVLPVDSGSIEIDGEVEVHGPGAADLTLPVQHFLETKVTVTQDPEKKIQLARDFADLFEFTSVLKQTLSQLSSGQKQKVILAGELINRPALLLLDEPFTHLDPFTRTEILQGLFRVIKHQALTLIWVTHELTEAFRFADKIGIMNFGRLEQLAAPAELSQLPRNLFVAQFLGFKNFIHVKKHNGFWQTPWGEWTFSVELPEGFLVVPSTSWKVVDGSKLPFRVMEKYPTPSGVILEVEREGKKLIVDLSARNPAATQSQLCLTPKWEDCFIIPL